MKKIIRILLLATLLLIPFKASAKEVVIQGRKYQTLNYEQTLAEANVQEQYSHYEEKDDQVVLYLFRGKDCEYCEQLLEFLSSITDEYGQYFKMVSFEIYQNDANRNLLEVVSQIVGAPGEGIPLLIIGDKYYEGFSSEYEESIKAAIKNNYEIPVGERQDIIDSIENSNISDPIYKGPSAEFKIIAWTFLFFVVSTGIVIFFMNYKMGKLEEKISLIRNKK